MADREDLIFSSDEDEKNNGSSKQNKNTKVGEGKVEQKVTSTLNVRSTGFKDFLLRPELMKGIGDAGFEHPSEIQQEAIPVAIYGKDLICQANSGMGKTAVFVLSVLHQLDLEGSPFQCLVLCHTRELAHQISQEFERLGKYMVGLKIMSIYGGVNIEKQILKLETKPPHIVIGTPGRTLHLVRDKKINLDHLRFFIVDECDRVLEQYDMRQTVQEIFIQTKPKKQVCMYTATLNEKIKETCLKFLKKVCEGLTISPSKKFTSLISQN
jgi:ATP-dependent RNA helicase UAP56/SUB2